MNPERSRRSNPIPRIVERARQILKLSSRKPDVLFQATEIATRYISETEGKPIKRGITELPDLQTVKPEQGIGVVGLPAFVQFYIGEQIDDEFGDDFTDTTYWLEKGKTFLGNSYFETEQLLKSFEENPYTVADYLRHVWGQIADSYIDQFLEKAENGELKKLKFE